MVSYSGIEQAIIDELVSHFSDFVDAKTVVGGESDALFEELFSGGKDKKYGILLEFGGGGRPQREEFKGATWEWIIVGIFMIRFTGQLKNIETELRSIVDVMANLFLQDHTLGKKMYRVFLERIDPPDVVEVNNAPMYWLPFQIVAWEKI